ncbi:MAG: hypothetical protein ACYDAJ_11240 [Nitrosotalea sp.]
MKKITRRQRREERLFLKLKNLIDHETTSVNELSGEIDRSTRQTRRYIIKMTSLGVVKLDPKTGMLVKQEK